MLLSGQAQGTAFRNPGGQRQCSRAPPPLQPCSSSCRPRTALQAAQQPGLFQKLGRVLREKAAGDYERFVQGTTKTRERLGLVDELLAFWSLEDYEEKLEELEEALIVADFGPKTALKVVDGIRGQIKSGAVKSATDLRTALQAGIAKVLTVPGRTSELQLKGKPSVILVAGVNGAGKTTTIGKLAHRLAAEGAKVYLAPGDTFRAAAQEQLAEWAQRSGATIGPFQEGAQPGDVLAESCSKALQDGTFDVVICDTAGRLHTAYGLMDELAQCRDAIAGALKGQPDEVLLVLDGTTGLNMLNQAREFNQAVPLTGLILTKLDGSAKGGAVVSVVDATKVPVKFIGVGEQVADLQAFDAPSFARALFPAPTESGGN